jgi:hypothetical protein
MKGRCMKRFKLPRHFDARKVDPNRTYLFFRADVEIF